MTRTGLGSNAVGVCEVDHPPHVRFRELRLFPVSRRVAHVEEALDVPPLRVRREDVPALVDHFLAAAKKRDPRVEGVSITQETRSALAAHDWPGNVRELRNVLDRALYRDSGAAFQIQLTARAAAPWPSTTTANVVSSFINLLTGLIRPRPFNFARE